MTDIAFVSLSSIPEERIIALMNDPEVGRHLPLLSGPFTVEDCRAFLAAKAALWTEHGYGPWAILVDGTFAGWGGPQPEAGEADFALVLDPRYWGLGRRIFVRVRDRVFGEMGLTTITALLPPGRRNSAAITRLGFVEEAVVSLEGQEFRRFRLFREAQ